MGAKTVCVILTVKCVLIMLHHFSVLLPNFILVICIYQEPVVLWVSLRLVNGKLYLCIYCSLQRSRFLLHVFVFSHFYVYMETKP